jgi:hypothetical protein
MHPHEIVTLVIVTAILIISFVAVIIWLVLKVQDVSKKLIETETRLNTAHQDVADAYNELDNVKDVRDELILDRNAYNLRNVRLYEMVNYLLAMQANMGESVEQATAILTNEFDTRGWNRGTKGKFVKAVGHKEFNMSKPVQPTNELPDRYWDEKTERWEPVPPVPANPLQETSKTDEIA